MRETISGLDQLRLSVIPGSMSPNVSHPLSMKVMRLRRPEFQVKNPILLETDDALGNKIIRGPHVKIGNIMGESGGVFKEEEKAKQINIDGLGYTDMWSLPNSFGKIYVGETFSSYISIHNHSNSTVRKVSIKAEMFTGNYKQTLLDLTNSPIASFEPGTNHDFVIEQPLGEQGTHMLVCVVSYEADIYVPGNEEEYSNSSLNASLSSSKRSSASSLTEMRSFRKLFKFPVSNPLGMKTVKVFTLNDHVFVHLELQNLTDGPLYVDTVKLDPSFGYILLDHSVHNSQKQHVYEHLMEKNEVRRLLFQMIPKKDNKPNVPSASPPLSQTEKQNQRQTLSGTAMPLLPSATRSSLTASIKSTFIALGKIELSWKNNMGETGMLMTNTINHKVPTKQEIDLEYVGLVTPEDQIIVEKPFEVLCNVWNRTVQSVELSLVFDLEKMYPLAVNCKSRINIGVVAPMSCEKVVVPLFALSSGVQSFGGGICIVLPKYNNRVYPVQHELSQIMVKQR